MYESNLRQRQFCRIGPYKENCEKSYFSPVFLLPTSILEREFQVSQQQEREQWPIL